MEISTATVLEALQRNFGGLPASDFQQVVTAFLEHLRRACGRHKFPDPEPGQFRPTLEVLSASLEETGHNLLEQHATLSDKAARPKLVIDYTGIVYMFASTFQLMHVQCNPWAFASTVFAVAHVAIVCTWLFDVT